MLLPESATGADIESARKLLIDRGSLDGSLGASYFTAWLGRTDIVEFKSVDLSNATNVQSAWQSCTSMTTFPALNLSSSTTLSYSWYGCSGLSNFGAIQAPVCTNFTNAWLGTSALTSFPAGAKLGTEATNVNFSSAWNSSGLTSFPADIDLSKGTNFYAAWLGCTSLTSFPLIDTSASLSFNGSWYNCSNLTSFPANFFDTWNPSSIGSGLFDLAWANTSLTAQSVENILTSIDASGKYATTNGASGGTALGDAGIDIDYNVATGSLSAATNSAVTSLKAKGWSIIVNNVTL